MVDRYGFWTYEPDTPEEKKCDCDRIADYIKSTGYEVKTTIENLVYIIIASFDYEESDDREYGNEFTVDGCIRYIEDSGGLAEFDYYA